MDIQFEKTVVPCLHTILQDNKLQEKTLDIKLSEELPDIGRVIMSWGQVLMRGKEWRDRAIEINCGVMIWVLYEPEDGGAPRCVEAWLPMQVSWNIDECEKDGELSFQPLLQSVETRCVSARKLVARVSVGVSVMATVQGEVICLSPSSVPEDIHLRNEEYIVSLPKEAGEKTFRLEEEFELPGDVPKLDSVVSYIVQPVVSEQRLMGDKLIIRGTADLHIVYSGKDGILCNWDFSLPFSQYSQLEQEYSSEAEAKIVPVLSSLEFERGEGEKLFWKIGITAQYIIYDKTTVSILSDAYSNSREIATKTESLYFPSELDKERLNIKLELSFDMEGFSVADASFCPDHPRIEEINEQRRILLSGSFRIVGYDQNGKLCGVSKKWEKTHDINADPSVMVKALMTPAVKIDAMYAGNGINLMGQLPLELSFVCGQGMPMITDLTVSDLKISNDQKPTLIIKKCGDKTLWDHAKSCGSTVESIRNANNLLQEAAMDQMLLIPIE